MILFLILLFNFSFVADGTGKFDVMIPDEELRHVTVNVFRENLAYFTFRTVTMFSPSNR